MKISVDWLKEYLPISLPVNELAEKISRTAVEVEDQIDLQGDMKNIVIAKVLSVAPHEDSDHLVVTQLDAGEEEPVQVVTGAPNVAAGQTVILAKHKSVIADGVKIKKGKLRGVPSNGMLCALQELGLEEKVSPKDFDEGIWVFSEEESAKLNAGDNALEVLGFDDNVLELGITPNRADMLSMNGTAWEVAAIMDEPVKLPSFELVESNEAAADMISVSADAALAPKYGVRVVKNVTVGDSPLWLQQRLWKMGIRPISNVVDVTNLMLLTYGQPLHAFDYNNLPEKALHVREAVAGEKITTLDGQDREAAAGDLVIASGDEALMFAGVMGGQSTEVTAQTQDVVLEAAIFEPKAIRHAARDQNLHSEASQRFERGVDMTMTFQALDHAAALIAEIAGGEVLAGQVIAQDAAYEAPEVVVSVDDINHVLGTTITGSDVAAIFTRLGFEFVEVNDSFTVSVPARRWDITIPADLIEEVARMYGYDNLPATLPTGETTPGQLTPKQSLLRATRHDLEGLGLNQAISYVLTTPEKATQFTITDSTPVELSYPMSQDRRATRGSLLTSLLDDVAYNTARNQSDLALYEQGRVFAAQGDDQQPLETEHLAGVLSGNFRARNWDQGAEVADFFTLKGIVEQLLTNWGMEARFVPNAERPEMHPGRTADIIINDEVVGFIGEVHPLTAKAYKINQTVAFEIDMDKIADLHIAGTNYEVVSRFPAISRDLAILVDRDVASADLMAIIRENGGEDLKTVTVFDVYTGSNVTEDKKSVAYSLRFENAAHTLVDEDINAAIEKITQALNVAFSAEIR
ncbi:phenylalanine--tRNA ligase subunit beta [Weissella ceti]|uniref:Phenylalanine--tRNA ligase beta subunit n=1 Tax=Weissella ceti TaxID=759620 RepID=A0ABT3E226_9LACO|nr:phenylalanine--tRNA ligase subunit beta [Weissella ceti]MCW0952489.1 phenylalanine--tRNA ligase subunit beta [Weissella ceti]QVK11841.1 phenylalanine--tRNA ligase subunit beta [Weissella ceti]